jgi:predicted NBD/HSP70 family sugar kinase
MIGRAVAPLCNALNPAVVVVGGRFVEAVSYVVDGIRESLRRRCATMPSDVRPAELGGRAEVLEPGLGILF